MAPSNRPLIDSLGQTINESAFHLARNMLEHRDVLLKYVRQQSVKNSRERNENARLGMIEKTKRVERAAKSLGEGAVAIQDALDATDYGREGTTNQPILVLLKEAGLR